MCDLPNIKGTGPKDINKVLNGYRKKLNGSVVARSWEIVRDKENAERLRQKMDDRSVGFDPDFERDMARDREIMRAGQLKSEGHQEYEIEISEETVEGVVSSNSDLK